MNGTTLDATVVKVIDGDTFKVNIPDHGEENPRILSLDTEESLRNSGKPVTPLGHAAADEAKTSWQVGDTITLEFPGKESTEDCLSKDRGNFDRLLVWAYKSGTDYQEYMIRKGFSPYFTKYGYACFSENHRRYKLAERDAQETVAGIWDQLSGNVAEANNYALLTTWWTLRAEVIEECRRYMTTNPSVPVLNTRLDYEELKTAAKSKRKVTIFTELREIIPIDGGHAKIKIGAIARPFNVFVPHAGNSPGRELINLLTQRYIPGDLYHPRRGYAYIQGMLKMCHHEPEIVVECSSQISDTPIPW